MRVDLYPYSAHYTGPKPLGDSIVTKGQLLIELWVLELGMLGRRSDEEAAN